MSSPRNPTASTTPKLDKFLTWVELHNKVVTLGLGASILLYGSKAPTVVLLICAARASGIANTKKNFILLFESFSKTTKAIQDAQPEISSQLNQLATLQDDLVVLTQKYQAGDISFEDHEKEKARIQKSLVVLQQVSTRMSLTLGQIIRSIDFKKLESVTHSLLMSMASVIAVQSSENAALVSRGYTISRQLSNLFYQVLSKYFHLTPPVDDFTSVTSTSTTATATTTRSNNTENNNTLNATSTPQELANIERSWHTLASVAGTVSGFVVTYIFRKLSYIITSCSLGAELVTLAVRQLVDPILIQNNLSILDDMNMALIGNLDPANILQMLLFSYGLIQVTQRSNFLERILLLPLTTLETFLNVLMFAKKI